MDAFLFSTICLSIFFIKKYKKRTKKQKLNFDEASLIYENEEKGER